MVDALKLAEPRVCWQSANANERQAELVGDSKFVVSWNSGWRAVRCGMYVDIMDWALGVFYKL